MKAYYLNGGGGVETLMYHNMSVSQSCPISFYATPISHFIFYLVRLLKMEELAI